jgi:hypothetical protein
MYLWLCTASDSTSSTDIYDFFRLPFDEVARLQFHGGAEFIFDTRMAP